MSITPTAPAHSQGGHPLSFLLRGSTQLGLFLILIAMWIIFSSLSAGFLSRLNLNSLFRSVAIDVVVGFAQMVVLATGGMNLAVGAIGVCVVMFAGYLFQVVGVPLPVGIVLTVLFGGVLGWLNGFAITRTGVNSFVVTLASASLFSGAMLILTKGVPFNNLPAALGAFGRMSIGPVPVLALVALALYSLRLHHIWPAGSRRWCQCTCCRNVWYSGQADYC